MHCDKPISYDLSMSTYDARTASDVPWSEFIKKQPLLPTRTIGFDPARGKDFSSKVTYDTKTGKIINTEIF